MKKNKHAKIIHTLASFQPQALKVGNPHHRESEMKEFLLLGLSGFRSAALPLPLGVFKPSERYWWPLSPSSSLRLAWNKKVQSFVPGHMDNYKKRGSLGYGPCQCCRLMPALTISVLFTHSGSRHSPQPGSSSGLHCHADSLFTHNNHPYTLRWTNPMIL